MSILAGERFPACSIGHQPTPTIATGLTRACRQRQWLRSAPHCRCAAATGAVQLQRWLAPQQQGLQALRWALRVPQWARRRWARVVACLQQAQHPAGLGRDNRCLVTLSESNSVC